MSFFDGLMSPLNKDHCMYFYFIGLAFLLFAIIALIIIVMSILKKKYKILGLAISYFITCLLTYYVSRLHYSVCLGAFK